MSEQRAVLYVAWLAKQNKKWITAKQYVGMIFAFFTAVGWPSSLEGYPRVRMILDGYKRLHPPTTRRKKFRVTTAILRRLQPHVRRSHKEQVLWALIVTAVQGLFRLGELVDSAEHGHLTWASYRRCGATAAAIFLPNSKTDYMRRGIEIYLAQVEEQICAPPLLDALRSQATLSEPMFAVNGYPATRSMVLGFTAELLKRAGIKSSATGHSFRQGGAQSLFDAGVSIEDIKIFGRWRSDAFRRYIEMSLERVSTCHARMAKAAASNKRFEL
jgi:hypothetical protein